MLTDFASSGEDQQFFLDEITYRAISHNYVKKRFDRQCLRIVGTALRTCFLQ